MTNCLIKKITAVLIVLCVFALCAPVTAFGSEVYLDYTYSVLEDDTVRIDSFTNMHAVSAQIPDEIGGMRVTRIKNRSFMHKRNLVSVTIPDSVEIIGAEAFSECLSLTEVSFGACVNTLGSYCFNNCVSLASVDLVNTEIIEDKCFYNCTSLTYANLGEKLVCIGGNAFTKCINLSSVVFSTALEKISDYAFSECASLISVTFPDSLESLGLSAFNKCTLLREVNFGKGVLSIGAYCFENCPSLLSVAVPPNIISVGKKAFALRNETEFSHAESFSVICQKGSYANDYCNANGLVPVYKNFNMLFRVGDLNGNGKIEVADARTVLRYAVGLVSYTHEQLYYADFNGSGDIDVDDARRILRTAVGLSA